jgi:hypothetical protein
MKIDTTTSPVGLARIILIIGTIFTFTACTHSYDSMGYIQLKQLTDQQFCDYKKHSFATFPRLLTQEMEQRDLGDCSQAYLICKGVAKNPKLYSECHMNVSLIELQTKTAEQAALSAANKQSWDTFNQNLLQQQQQKLIQQQQKPINTYCRPTLGGAVSCTSN